MSFLDKHFWFLYPLFCGGVLAFCGCTQDQLASAEKTTSTLFNDLQVVSEDVTRALPTVVAAAEIIAPNSTKTANLANVAGKITTANGVLQTVTLTFPPITSGTSTSALVLSSVQATSSALAQLAPAAAQIAEKTAPGSTIGVDLTKGTAVMNLVNGGVQSITITAPPAPVTPPAPATTGQ